MTQCQTPIHRTIRSALPAWALCLLLSVCAALAALPVAAAPDGTLLAGQVELPRLVDLAAARNSVSVEYDAAVVKGTVTLRIDRGIGDEEIWSLMNRVLAQRGLTTVRIGSAADGAVRSPEVTGVERAPSDDPRALAPDGRALDGPDATDQEQADPNSGAMTDAAAPIEGGTPAHGPMHSPAYSVVRLQDASSVALPVLGIRGPVRRSGGGPVATDSAAVAAPSITPHEFARERRLLPIGHDDGAPAPGYMCVLVRVQHMPAREAVEAAGRVLSKPAGSAVVLGHDREAQLEPGRSSPGIVQLCDLTPRLERALELLALLDVPGANSAIEEVEVRHLPANQLATLAMQVTAKRDAVWGGTAERTPGEIVASPDGSSVLILAPLDRVEWWKSLLDRLDRREPVSVSTYRPRHFPAADVANLIEQTVRDIGAGPVGSGPAMGGSASARDERWKIVIDDLTGSLIITATPAQHAAIADLIARLDSTPAAARRPVRSFVIKNRSVNEVRSILEQLIRAGVLEAGEDGLGAQASGPDNLNATTNAGAQFSPFPPSPQPDPILTGADAAGSARPTAQPGTVPGGPGVGTSGGGLSRRRDSLRGEQPGLVLTVDEGTNTLIAVGEPRLLAQIESLLPTIDVRQPQVMLEVLLVTLSEAQSLDLGIELEQLILSGDLRIRLSSLFGLGMRAPSGDRVGPDNASGFTGVVLSPGDFSIVVRALQTLNNGRSVSMPRLLVGNNQSATINSVLQQPFASVNASNTVSTTSFGGTQDAGTVVTIRPQIAEGDHLIMDYSVSLSSFVGTSSSATLPPPRQQNQVRSVATIPDGYTVVVGGIELETDSRSISQVPLLGDIPVIGEAFKTRSKTGTRSKFFVFIRANVLRGKGFEDLKFLSAQDARAARVDDGLPRVRARVIR